MIESLDGLSSTVMDDDSSVQRIVWKFQDSKEWMSHREFISLALKAGHVFPGVVKSTIEKEFPGRILPTLWVLHQNKLWIPFYLGKHTTPDSFLRLGFQSLTFALKLL